MAPGEEEDGFTGRGEKKKTKRNNRAPSSPITTALLSGFVLALVLLIIFPAFGAVTTAYGTATAAAGGDNGDGVQVSDSISADTTATTLGSRDGGNSTAAPGMFRGKISSVQMGESNNSGGEPEWIQSGIWVLRAGPGDSPQNATLVARFSMVMVNGTAMHEHRIYGLQLADSAMDGNGTRTFSGTATVTMRSGPVPDVPIQITIFNDSVLAMRVGPEKIDSHFGTDPIYGILSTPAAAKRAAEPGGQISSSSATTPKNSAAVELEGLARSRSVNYYGNATGYLVYPESGNRTQRLPAVVMIHEWWGLNQNIKNMAEQLAKEGYVVLAADLYSGEVATEPGRAQELSRSVRDNQQEAVKNLNAAVEYLSRLDNVDSSRIASLGWCFGGGQSLQLALNSDRPLAATVIYYGNPVTDPQQLSRITWPVLGIFGSADRSIPVDTVNQFKNALDSAGVKNEIHIYEGVGHAFANPSGDNYAPKETADAWQKTTDFLKRNLLQAST